MGRKGQCGGTAGGGRSGRKGGLTYNRVIPKFLQRLAGPDYTANPVDAKRHRMNSHPTEVDKHEEDSRRERMLERKRQKDSDIRKRDVQDEIRRLQADGFNVVEEPVEEKTGGEEQLTVNEAVKNDEEIAGNRGESEKRLRVRGGIEKKRASTGQVVKAFGIKNRQKLSFAESDSDNESG